MPQKQTWIAYVSWFFLGAIGIHRFYLRQTTTAIIMLIIGAGSFLLAGVIGTLLHYAILIWWIVDAFLIPGMVRRANGFVMQAAPAAAVPGAGVPTATIPTAADDGVSAADMMPDGQDAGDFADDITD